LDKAFRKTDIRARLPWNEAEKQEGLRRAFALWQPICDAHGCSFAALVEAWALTQYEKMSLLVGMRRPENLRDNLKCLELKLTADEIEQIEAAVRAIQVEVLDK
jgi:methylglyoxal reductase